MKVLESIIIMVLLCAFSKVYAQGNDTINITDNKGLKQGYWKEFKENNGAKYLVSEGKYSNNLKVGNWTEYYLNEKIMLQVEWKEGKMDGKVVTFYPNGNICESGTWKNDRWMGEFIHYYETTSTPYYKYTLDANGKRIESHSFSPDGKEVTGN